MTLAVDTHVWHGLSNEVRRELLPKKRGSAVFAIHYMVRHLSSKTNKMEHFSFKSGRPVWVAKLTKEDWPIVLQ